MAPFQYSPFVDPYTPSIGELLAHQNDAQAHAAESIAASNARATEIRGNAWARAAEAIGQIPQQIQAAKDAEQQRQLRAQDIASRAIDVQQKTAAMQREQANQKVGALVAQHVTTTPDGHLVYDVNGFMDAAKQDPTVAPYAHEPLDAMQKANDVYQGWKEQRFATKDALIKNIWAKVAETGGSPDAYMLIAGPSVKSGMLDESDLAPMYQRISQVPDQLARVKLLNAAAGVKPEYKEVPAGGTLNLLMPGAPPEVVASSPAKRSEAEQALDAYAKSVGKTKAEDLTDADRQAFIKRDAQVKAETAFAQHVREHAYDTAHQAPAKGKSQDELEQEGRGILQREFSSRSGGLGTEDAKVNQAIHLLTLMDQYEGKPMPAQIHGELALGLARLTSPNGQVGIELEREFKQKTAEEGISKAVAYLTGDPTLVNATPEKLRDMLRDSITRQGHVAEENRQTYLNAMLSLLPTQLEASRRASISKSVTLNKVDTVQMQAPNGQVKDVPRNQIEHFKALGAKVIGG